MIVLDKTRLTGGLPPRNDTELKNTTQVQGGILPQDERSRKDYLVLLTIALKAFGSLTASSDRTLRSSSILAALRPAISLA